MKKITNETANIKAKIFGTSSCLFVVLNIICQEVLLPSLKQIFQDSIWGILIFAVISGVLYLFLFTVVKIIYKIIINKKSDLRLNTKNIWYHVHIPYNEKGDIDLSMDRVRAGTTIITKDFYDIMLRGINQDYCVLNDEVVDCSMAIDNYTTFWQSASVVINDGIGSDIIEVYSAINTKIKNENGEKRLGTHCLNYIFDDKNNVKEITGVYLDSFPSKKGGRIFLFNNKNDRDEKIRRYFKLKSQDN